MEPKIRYWYENGQKYSEIYRVNGQSHRTDGPAYISWHENGQKHSEIYLVDGKRHRIDGPAVTRWYENGQRYEEYWIHNKRYTKEDFEASWEYQSYLFDLEVADNF